MTNIRVGVTDHLDPEEQAMLLAMYSRTFTSIESRLPQTPEEHASLKERLHKFYVNYGHKSVGQLGSTTIFFEGVSQIAAKALEDTPLFNGQESSTRYIDYSNQPMYNSHPVIKEWQEKFRALYIKALPLTFEKVMKEYPLDEQSGVSITTYQNTIKARAFDICRGILPAGSTTNVGFSGTFDTLNEHLGKLLKHPCQEVSNIAANAIGFLAAKYPSAGYDLMKHYQRNSFIDKVSYFYYTPDIREGSGVSNSFLEIDNASPRNDFIVDALPREKFSTYPRHISDKCRMTYSAFLDFGGYRDIHRHRNGYCSMPLLTAERGIHPFYLQQLPEGIATEFKQLVVELNKWSPTMIGGTREISKYEFQYAIPMGCVVYFEYSCELNQALYITELRSGKTVHQTVRQYAQDWATKLTKLTSGKIKIHADMGEDNFTLKRGTQTLNIN